MILGIRLTSLSEREVWVYIVNWLSHDQANMAASSGVLTNFEVSSRDEIKYHTQFIY